MKAFEDLTDQEIFDLCANKTLEEIKAMPDEEYQAQAIRYYFSRLLMNYPDENPLKEDYKGEALSIMVETEEDCGLSTLQKLHIAGFSQTEGEGYINVWFEGCTEPTDIDCFTTKEQLKILEDLISAI